MEESVLNVSAVAIVVKIHSVQANQAKLELVMVSLLLAQVADL
jgi:hypothetical protein